VDAIVGERIGRLPEHLKQVLTLASPQGETFTAEVVAKQMNIEPRDIIQLLSTDLDKKHNLVRAQGIQRINGERLSQYRFRHALFQRYLYNTLDKVERTYLHEEVGLILEDFYGEQTNEISVQLARHFRKAGIVDKALNYLMQAATHSKQVFANEAALEHFQTALILIDKAFAGDKKSNRFRHLKADILEGLGDVQAILGHHDDARSSFQNGLTQIANDDIMSQSRLRRKTGKTFEVQRRFDEALKTLESAEAILGEPGEKTVDWWYEWIEVQTERIWHHYWLGQLEKMTELANNAEPAVEQYGNPAQRATFYNGLTLLAYRRDRYVISDETVSHSRTALSASEESENMNSIGMSRFLLGFTLLWRRDLEEAEEQLLEGLKVVEATGDIVLQSRCLTYLTVVYRKRGEVEKVRQYVPKCLAAAKSGQMIEYVATANANTAWLAWNDGNLSEAEGKGQEALETWQRVLVGHASCAMQWLAAWPLISVALAKDQIPDALDLAGILLQETQQRMPDRLTAILEESLEIWDTGNVEKTRAKLEQAEAEAKRMSYL
jgi:tetratricopeptide (TPR) repeat protein